LEKAELTAFSFVIVFFLSYNIYMAKKIYNLTAKEILKKFGASESGLSENEAAKKLIDYGLNRIENKESWRISKLILAQFNDALVWIMLVAAVLAFAFGEMRDVAIILIIVLINSIIGFTQEWKAERLMDKIQKLASDKATVLRNGKKREVEASEIVPGDIVFVSSGDNVPADGYILESYNFYTNSFVFTGESKPEVKEASIITKENLPLADIDNMVFAGEQVTRGEAKFVITATGIESELGKIANLATSVADELTPLQKKMRILGRDISILAVFIALIVLVAGGFRQMTWYQNFLFALAVAVSVVPEGLPAALSVALSLGMRRLLKKNVLVKKLIAVETLGSVNVICTDKTGTITKNEMMVTKIILDNKEIEVSGEGYSPEGEFLESGNAIDPKNEKNLEFILKIGSLCNDASLTKEGENFSIIGDPTEGALVVAARKYDGRENFFGAGENKVGENPFESKRMMMSVVYQNDDINSNHEKKTFSYVKGSPEKILSLSPKKLTKEGIVPFSEIEKEKTKKIYDEMSGQALRVLAFAYRPLDNFDKKDYQNASERDLVWVGMMAMIDPPRVDVAKAIKECQEAGIKVIMITGDYEITARSIAEKVGLLAQRPKTEGQNNNSNTVSNFVVNGKELYALSDRSLLKRVKDGASVFARITPEQKLRIASILKKSGAVIAMTGDGVNDAPALKKADIGVAMGKIGTDVSKEASDIILLDDNFSSIVAGIKEGRTIYQNIRKFIYYVLSSNASEFLTVIFGTLLSIPSPIAAVQILAIDLGTDVFPSLALGLEGPEPGGIKHKPYDPKERLIGSFGFRRLAYVAVIMATGAVVAFLWSMRRGGWDFGQKIDFSSALYIKSTAATFAVLSMTQMANLIQTRSENISAFKMRFFGNIYLVASIFISVCVLLSFMYVPFFQKYLRMSPIDIWDWMVVAGAFLAVFFFEEARKAGNAKHLSNYY
jgi:P-type Ca2+ transporter type 2C